MLTGKFLVYDYILIAFESFICFVFCNLLHGTADVLMDYTKKDCFTTGESISVIITLLLLLLHTAGFPGFMDLRLCVLISVFTPSSDDHSSAMEIDSI